MARKSKAAVADLASRAAAVNAEIADLLERVYAERIGDMPALPAEVGAAIGRLQSVLRDAGLLPKPRQSATVGDAVLQLAHAVDDAARLYKSGEEDEAVKRLWLVIEQGDWNTVSMGSARSRTTRQKAMIRHWLANHVDRATYDIPSTAPIGAAKRWIGRRAKATQFTTTDIVRDLARDRIDGGSVKAFVARRR